MKDQEIRERFDRLENLLHSMGARPTVEPGAPNPWSGGGTGVMRTAEEIDSHYKQWKISNPNATSADWQVELQLFLGGK